MMHGTNCSMQCKGVRRLSIQSILCGVWPWNFQINRKITLALPIGNLIIPWHLLGLHCIIFLLWIRVILSTNWTNNWSLLFEAWEWPSFVLFLIFLTKRRLLQRQSMSCWDFFYHLAENFGFLEKGTVWINQLTNVQHQRKVGRKERLMTTNQRKPPKKPPILSMWARLIS